MLFCRYIGAFFSAAFQIPQGLAAYCQRFILQFLESVLCLSSFVLYSGHLLFRIAYRKVSGLRNKTKAVPDFGNCFRTYCSLYI